MDTSLLALYALLDSGLVHPQGHVIAGKENNIPVEIDYKTKTENWKTKDKEKDSKINAGGFKYQGLLADALDGSKINEESRTALALYKFLYPLLVDKVTSGKSKGDIKNLENSSDSRNVKGLLYLSALSDLYRARNPEGNGLLKFTTFDNGTPGLIYERKF